MLDSDSGEYVKKGCSLTTSEGCCSELGSPVADVGKDECVDPPGAAVTFAGPSSMGLDEAGGVLLGFVAVVGTIIASPLVNAIGGSHEPRQSRPHVAQEGSISRM